MVESDEKKTEPTIIKKLTKKEISTIKNKARFLELFNIKANNISLTCKSIGINRDTYYNWMLKDPEFEAAIKAEEENLIDWAESKLRQLMSGYKLKETKVGFHKGKVVTHEMDKNIGPDNTSLIFFLKTKGKQRGYVERTENIHDFQGANTIEMSEDFMPDVPPPDKKDE